MSAAEDAASNVYYLQGIPKAVESNTGMYAKICVEDCESVAISFQGNAASNNSETSV